MANVREWCRICTRATVMVIAWKRMQLSRWVGCEKNAELFVLCEGVL